MAEKISCCGGNAHSVSQMFKVIKDQLYFDDFLIGSSKTLYMAHLPDFKGIRNERARGIVRATLPPAAAHIPVRFDIICVSDDRVLGFESKHPADLLNSHTNRRLSRQLSLLLASVGVAGLIIRGQAPTEDRKGEWPRKLYKDLVRWQELGVRIIIGPELDNDLPEFIAELRPIMTGKSVRGVLTWGEKKEYDKGYLLRAIKGVGSLTSKRLLDEFGTVEKALMASDEEWLKIRDVGPGIIKARREALK